MEYVNERGEVIATDTFTFQHVVCGATVQVIDAKEQPHRCRIDLDAQRGRG